MKVGEAAERLHEFDQDISAEADPRLRAWYGQETSLQPEFQEALKARLLVGRLASVLSHLQETWTPEETLELSENFPNPAESADSEPSELEEPVSNPLEDVVKKWGHQYDKDMAAAATTVQNRKRQHQQKIAANHFMLNLERMKINNQEQHVIYSAEDLSHVLLTLGERAPAEEGEPDLYDEVFSRVGEFARDNAFDIMSDPRNLADILDFSTRSDYIGEAFDYLLTSLFDGFPRLTSLRQFDAAHSQADAQNLLMDASFELFGKRPALLKTLRMLALTDDSIRDKTGYGASVGIRTYWGFATEDTGLKVEAMEQAAALNQLTQYLNGTSEDIAKLVYLKNLGDPLIEAIASNFVITAGLSDELKELHLRAREALDAIGPTVDYDRLRITELVSGETFHGETRELDPEVLAAIHDSHLHRRRLKYLAPAAYATSAALKIAKGARDYNEKVETEDLRGWVQNISISPTESLTICVFGIDEVDNNRRGSIEEVMGRSFIEKLLDHPGTEAITNSSDQPITLRYLKLDYREDGLNLPGIVFVRSAVPGDRFSSHPVHRLHKSVVQLKRAALLPDDAERVHETTEELRQNLIKDANRFIGRRPIRFRLPPAWQAGGLRALRLRKDDRDPRQLVVNVEHRDEDVELRFDENFRIIGDFEGQQDALGMAPVVVKDVRLMALRFLTWWSCRATVETSEGTISDEEAKSTLGLQAGHFAYLRVRNGKAYNFSEDQAEAYLAEQGHWGTTLEEESQRRRLKPRSIDPTAGVPRNSTYVREKHDPRAQPLEIYYDSAILD